MRWQFYGKAEEKFPEKEQGLCSLEDHNGIILNKLRNEE